MQERLNGIKQNESIAPERAVLSKKEYLSDLGTEIQRAKEGVFIETLGLEAPVAEAVLRMLKTVPAGVRQDLYIDEAQTLYVAKDRLLMLDSVTPGRTKDSLKLLKEKIALLQRFAAAGVTLHLKNPPRNFVHKVIPYIGRSHKKGAGIDCQSSNPEHAKFYFGSANLDYPELVDLMVKFTGNNAKVLSSAFDDINAGRVKEDEQRQLDEYSNLYIDVGAHGKSIILDKAAGLIKQAQSSVEFVTMLMPDGKMLNEFRDATSRGLRYLEVITSGAVTDFATRGIGEERLRHIIRKIGTNRTSEDVVIRTVPQGGVHAKLLVVDRGARGQKIYFGSHNLNEGGVKLGTQECGIITSDPVLCRNLLAWYDDLRKSTELRTR